MNQRKLQIQLGKADSEGAKPIMKIINRLSSSLIFYGRHSDIHLLPGRDKWTGGD